MEQSSGNETFMITLDMFTCTFKTVLHMRSLIIKIFDETSFDRHYSYLTGMWFDVLCDVVGDVHCPNGDFLTNHVIGTPCGIVLYLHLPIPGFLK